MSKLLLKIVGLLSLIIGLHAESEAKTIKPQIHLWKRLDGAINNLKIAPKGKWLAYTDQSGKNLKVMNIETNNIYLVSQIYVGHSFFWAPDGCRLFYREMGLLAVRKQVLSTLKAFDCALRSSNTLERMPYQTGILTFDPRDLRLFLMHSGGIMTRRISFPDGRLARWQLAQRTENGRWIIAQNGVLWVSRGGFAMKKLSDDQSGVAAFDISPDGNTIAWATKNNQVYISHKGEDPLSIGYGKDPHWHPHKPFLVFAAGRMIGKTASDLDLKIIDRKGRGKWLTHSQGSAERWPRWVGKNKIIFTKQQSLDLYVMDLKP